MERMGFSRICWAREKGGGKACARQNGNVDVVSSGVAASRHPPALGVHCDAVRVAQEGGGVADGLLLDDCKGPAGATRYRTGATV